MKLFLDSANLSEIRLCLEKGFLSGVTTNPSILAKEPKADFVGHIKKITELFQEFNQPLPLSVEVFTNEPSKMIAQAEELFSKIDYKNLNIKIPIGWEELKAISVLTRRNIPVNCTCLFTEGQAVLAANAGARYISIFYARLRDIGGDPHSVIQNTRKLLDSTKSNAEIIVGSIRQPMEITGSFMSGAHIVTSSSKWMEGLATHPQTTKSIDGFLQDFQAWLS